MNAGFNRLIPTVKCFRDEDWCGDRCSGAYSGRLGKCLSLTEQGQEIQDITEGLIARVMKETKASEVTLPFPV